MTPQRIAALPDDDWRKGHGDFREPELSRNLKLVRLLRAIARQRGCTPAEVAIAWVLRHPVVTGAIVGARRPDQVLGLLGAADMHLSTQELGVIDAFFSWAAA
jgi:aryl-alcohol dehydrogenase-like predicted oxidoreductase